MNRNKLRGRKRAAHLITLLAVITLTFLGADQAQAQWTAPDANGNTTYNDGNVGIGTTSPSFPVTINKDGGLVTGNFYNVLQMDNAAASKGVNFGYNNSDSSGILAPAGTADFTIWGNGGSGYAEKVRFTSSGNVGIGTTGPAGRLELVNTAGAFTASNYFQVTGATSTNSHYPGISLKGGTLVNEYPYLQLGNGGLMLTINAGRHSTNYPNRIGLALSTNATGSGSASFQLFNGTTTTNLLTVKDNGNVGIGTTGPGAKLDIARASAGTDTHVRFTDGAYSVGSVSTVSSTDGVGLFISGRTEGTAAASPTLTLAGYTNDVAAVNAYDGAVVVRGYDISDSSTLANAPIFKVLNAASSAYLTVAATGNVGIGTSAPAAKLDVNGDINVTGNINAKYQDVAEWVPASRAISAATVVVLDPEKSNQVLPSAEAYDTRVAGVVSERPGLALGEAGKDKVLVATTGRVKVKVDATRSPVRIGDLLVTSDREGYAMKSEPITVGGRKLHAPGTLIGKALEPLESGTGEILVLLSLQ